MSTPEHDTASIAAAVLAEFSAIKEEIRARSHDQATVISLNVTAIGVVSSLYIAEKADPSILFLIPIISSLLGIRFIDHAININNLGRFIQYDLKPMLNRQLNCTLPDYEEFAEGFASRGVLRFFLLALPVGLLFAGLPAVALIFPFLVVPPAAYSITFWTGAALGGVFLFVFVVFWATVVRGAKRNQPHPSSDTPPLQRC